MDLKQIREELRRLSALVEGWLSAGELSALERDLALEKLRALYDAVRFVGADEADAAETAPADEAAPMAVPVDLGLDVMLAPATAPADDIANLPEERSVEPEPAPVPAEPESAPEPIAEPEAVVVESLEPEPESEFVSESTAEPEPLPLSQAEQPQEPEQPGEPELIGPDAESVSEPEPVSTPEPVAAPEPAPQPVVGSLFGFEEDEVVRHRRKQRVIMSLYDAAEPAKPAAKEKPAVGVVRPEEQPVAEQPIAVPAAEAAPDKPVAEPIQAPAAQSAPAPTALSASAPASESPEVVRPKADAPTEEPDLQEIVLSPGSVLGEVINHDVQTLADTIEAPRDMASELKRREPVTDLERAIGINDKFLMIRDLFGGDAAAYEAAVRTLNGFNDLDDCMIHIAEHYAWNPNSDGAKLMMELLERKFA